MDREARLHKRIPRTADFVIDGPEFELYQKITRFVKRQSAAPQRRATTLEPGLSVS